ncbi:MAG TPA: COX15/CtaA family protein [Planctomicrobium sp.]|nr:COX15/CtaA family protein [Planctomicrobium sp.]
MSSSRPSRVLYYTAIAEVALALVTLIFGALTTSKNAGMAFADWPTSDGYFMITYPWLRDFASNWGKFLEHGHRLAGMVIGIWSILLVIVAYRVEERKWVRLLSIGILLGVICQGLLGGFRVQLNDRGLAMLHGIFASIVFSLMGTMVAVTSIKWRTVTPLDQNIRYNKVKWWSTACVILVMLQYLYGSLVRHQGRGLHEHLGLGFVVLIIITINAVIAWRQPHPWIKRSGLLLLLIASMQVVFGLKTWILKFGFPTMGYVAVADSIQAVSIRTLHMVWGAVMLMAAVVHVLKVYRVATASRDIGVTGASSQPDISSVIKSGGPS